jgi:hypothetical protein
MSRRQLVKIGGALALNALLPGWEAPARAASTGLTRAAKITGSCPPQTRGTCTRARAKWTPACKQKVAKGNSSEFNGCGPQAGLDLPILGHGDWIPDQPLGLANFYPACVAHDCCYGRCGSDKSTCDSNFQSDLNAICAGTNQGHLIGSLLAALCFAVADIYHAAVADTQTGQDAYNAGQAEVCDCCQTWTVSFDSTIEIEAGSGGSGSWKLEYAAMVTITTPDDPSSDGTASGSGQGSYSDASGTISGDGVDTTVTGATPDAFDVVKFDSGTSSATGTPAAPSIVLNLHEPSEQYHAHDSNAGEDFDYTDKQWLQGFMEFHPAANGVVTLTLEPGTTSDVVAKGVFTNVSPDASVVEVTTVTVSQAS